MKLRRRLFLSFLAIVLVVTVAIGIGAPILIKDHLIDTRQAELSDKGTDLVRFIRDWQEERITYWQFGRLINNLDHFLGSRIWILDNEDRLIFASEDLSSEKSENEIRSPLGPPPLPRSANGNSQGVAAGAGPTGGAAGGASSPEPFSSGLEVRADERREGASVAEEAFAVGLRVEEPADAVPLSVGPRSAAPLSAEPLSAEPRRVPAGDSSAPDGVFVSSATSRSLSTRCRTPKYTVKTAGPLRRGR